MRRIDINKVQPNTVIGEDIYTTSGICLIARGAKLTTKILDRLKSYGFSRLAVEDERFKDIEIATMESLKEENKIKALSITKSILDNYSKSSRIENIKEMNNVVEQILEDILSNTSLGVDISNIQGYDSGTYTHSLSVTILSLYIGKKMNLNDRQLKDIGMGGLLHDVGKINIPVDIINKPGKLTADEFEVVKKHPMDGYVQIKDKISLLAAHIALQHHEKFDGTGYPRGLKKDEIHIFGRIAAVADVYDAITADRPYRKGMPTNKALRIILDGAGTHFDPEVVESFFKIIAVYPNGSILKLDDNSKAIVVSQNTDHPLKPNLLVFEKDNTPIKNFVNLDLRERNDINILEICQE